MSDPEFQNPFVKLAFDTANWEYFEDSIYRSPDSTMPSPKDAPGLGFPHVFEAGEGNNFENLFEMQDDGLLIGRFAFFIEGETFSIGFENEVSAVAFKLKM